MFFTSGSLGPCLRGLCSQAQVVFQGLLMEFGKVGGTLPSCIGLFLPKRVQMAPKLPQGHDPAENRVSYCSPERGPDKDIEDERPSWLSEGAWVESAKGGPNTSVWLRSPSCARALHGAGTLGLT